MPYKAYLEKREIEYKTEEVSRLESLDTLCNKCQSLPHDELLCDGYRVFMDEDATKFYKRLTVYNGPCTKKRTIIRTARIMAQISRSGVPESVAKQFVNEPSKLCDVDWMVEGVEDEETFFVNSVPTPFLGRIDTSDDTIMESWKLIIALNLAGVPAKWLWPKSVSQRDYRVDPEFWTTLFHKLTTQTEFLVVHRADMHLGADFKKEIFIKVLEYRLMNRLPTFVSIGDNPSADTEEEQFVYKTIQKLPEVTL